MENQKKNKEPLLHITKRAVMPVWQKILIRAGAILSAMILCGVLAFALIPKLAEDPSRIGKFYFCFIKNNFYLKVPTDPDNNPLAILWEFLKDVAVLLCISLAITPAFRMKFWNIGAEGQVLVGVLAAEGIAYLYGSKFQSELLLLLVMLVSAVIAGAVWGIIPAIFKAKWGTNETLFTLMMNYVATYLVAYCLTKWITSGSMVMDKLSCGILPSVFNQYFSTILLVLLLTVTLYFYLNYSKHGYEISVVGESENTAKYIGIDVKKVIIRTMILSGALCGFAGFLIGAGVNNSVSTTSVGGCGFTAIMVSWLAKFSPVYMMLTAGFIVFLERGASSVADSFDVTGALTDIFVGLTLFFIIGCEFFINYRLHIRNIFKKEEKTA